MLAFLATFVTPWYALGGLQLRGGQLGISWQHTHARIQRDVCERHEMTVSTKIGMCWVENALFQKRWTDAETVTLIGWMMMLDDPKTADVESISTVVSVTV